MTSRLFTLAAALSLLLCVATVVLWVRSYHSAIAIPFRYHNQRWEISSLHGRLVVENIPQQMFEMVRLRDGRANLSRLQRAYQGTFISAKFDFGTAVDAEHAVDIRDALRLENRRMDQLLAIPPTSPASHSVSFVILLIAMMVLPLCRAVMPRKRKPVIGQCTKCGYDLRASKDRCPECGTPILVKARVVA
jgi:hypothetical protein